MNFHQKLQILLVLKHWQFFMNHPVYSSSNVFVGRPIEVLLDLYSSRPWWVTWMTPPDHRGIADHLRQISVNKWKPKRMLPLLPVIFFFSLHWMRSLKEIEFHPKIMMKVNECCFWMIRKTIRGRTFLMGNTHPACFLQKGPPKILRPLIFSE